MNWDDQGYAINNGYAWYRVHMTIPSTILKGAEQQKFVVFDLPKADDADECYLNGRLIGKTGGMPDSPGGYKSNWNAVRSYTVDVKSGGILWDKDNVIAIRVYNAGEPGGLFERPLSVRVPSAMDGLSIHFTDVNDGKAHCDVQLRNTYPQVQNGKLDVVVTDRESGAVLSKLSKKMSVKQNKDVTVSVPYDKAKSCLLTTTYTDSKTGKTITQRLPLKYILTPPAPATPRFNGAPLFGVRPGSPVIYRFPVSGERPMKFTCANLPEGLTLKEADGVLSGTIRRPGDYKFTVVAENVASYQWQISTDGGNTWSNSSKTDTISFALTASRMGYKVKCILTGTDGTTKETRVCSIIDGSVSTELTITQ
jgi:hypothetical protein